MTKEEESLQKDLNKNQEGQIEAPTAKQPNTSARAPYIGYAYAKNLDKPKTMYGQTPEEIIQTLQKWNHARTQGYTYDTCNIGYLNSESQKYEDYRKFDVATGKDISKIFLTIPKGLSKEEFQDTLNFFKENGAKFSSIKKQWYISAEQRDDFKKYLNVEKTSEKEVIRAADTETEKRAEENTHDQNHADHEMKKLLKDLDHQNIENKPSVSVLQHIAGIGNEYVVDLRNGESIRVSEKEVLDGAGVASKEELRNSQIVDVLERKVADHLQLIPGEEYDMSVGKRFEDNRCTIYMHNGQIIDLMGDQYGVHFPSLEEQDVRRIVAGYLQQSNVTSIKTEETLQIGREVTLSYPHLEKNAAGILEVGGIESVKGIVREIDVDTHTYSIENSAGIHKIHSDILYDERQTRIIKKAIEQQMTRSELDLIGQSSLNAAQMEQVYEGLRDGLDQLQVANYATPKIDAAMMDIYRYGMENGLAFDNIKDMISSGKNMSWEDNRRLVDKMIKAQRNVIIKDLKNHKFIPEAHLVKKMEKLNGITGKTHSVNEIMAAKEGLRGAPDGLFKDISNELHRQSSMVARMERAQVPAINEMIPTK